MSRRPLYINQSISGRVFDCFNALVMFLIVVFMLYPFINTLVISFNDGMDAVRGGVYVWPRKFTLANFQLAFRSPNLLRGAVVSVIRTTIGVITGVLCTALLGYIVSCKRFMGRKLLRTVFIITMYFSGGLIPSYLLMLRLGFVNTLAVYWVPSLFSAYYMILASSYIQNIPDSLFESARIDGASELRILLQFVIPLSLPMLACIAIYIGVGHWNSWFDINLYSKDGRWDNLQIILYRLKTRSNAIAMMTEQMRLYDAMRTVQPLTVRAAVTVIVTLPIVLIYPFFQRYFVSGITLGSVKQ
jgi:putative aldouronate transport system permease protein